MGINELAINAGGGWTTAPQEIYQP